jgi:hypothetical protein
MTRWIKLNLQCYLPPGGYASHLEKFTIKKEQDGFSVVIEESESALPNISTSYDGSALRTISPLVNGGKVSYKFDWSSLLSLSEDRGISGLISTLMFKQFYFEQMITKTLQGRTPPNKTFVDRIPIVLVATPYKGCTLDDCTVFILCDDGTTHEGFEFDYETPLLGHFIRGDLFAETGIPNFMDKIQINGPSTMDANTTIELEIVPPYEQQTVYIEYDGGYINKIKFKGTNKIVLDSRLMSSGDQIKIKTGYKYWVSDNEKIITIN